jgi:hypothetical protein
MPEHEPIPVDELSRAMMLWTPEQWAQAYRDADCTPSLADLIRAAQAASYVRGAQSGQRMAPGLVPKPVANAAINFRRHKVKM